jgi:hypothetical protein
MTDKLTATLQIAHQIYSLAQEQNNAALIMGSCQALSSTFYSLGEFETARQYATRGVLGLAIPMETRSRDPTLTSPNSPRFWKPRYMTTDGDGERRLL